MLSTVPNSVLKKGQISPSDYQKLADACDMLYSMPIFIDDNSDLSPLEMRGKCRRLKAEHGLSFVMIGLPPTHARIAPNGEPGPGDLRDRPSV